MFGTIRKHQTWLWAVIITLTIISFVVFFSPYSRMNEQQSGPNNYGTINGEKITREDLSNADREVRLEYFFMSGGNWLRSEDEAKRQGFDIEQRTYARLLLVQKLKQFGIYVGGEVAGQYATEMLRPYLQRINLPNPEAFVNQVLRPAGFQIQDFDRFIRNELGIQELIATVGVSGKLVTPQEAQSLYEREHQELSTEAVFFSGSNYLDKVTVTPEAITQFYTNQLPNYRIPERVQVAYVKFDVSNYLAKAQSEMTNLTDNVEAYATKLGTNFYKSAKTLEESKSKIREDMVKAQAMKMAQKEATEFARPLYDVSTNQVQAFEGLAKTNSLTVKVSEPFDREAGPKDLDAGPDFTKYAFNLTMEQPVAGPLPGLDGMYVIAFGKKFSSEMPTLDTIREKVTTDYKYVQAVNLARKAGMEFSQSLTNAQNKSFVAFANEAKLKPIPLPPFSLSSQEVPGTEEHISLNGRGGLKEVAFSTPVGKTSEFYYTREGGIILHVKSALPLDHAKMQADLGPFTAYVRQSRQREAFESWFRKEADRGLRDTPLSRQPRQPPAMTGAAKS